VLAFSILFQALALVGSDKLDVANGAGFTPQVNMVIKVIEVENPANNSDLIILKGGFSTSDHSYKFELRSDGTGEIVSSDFPEDREEFAHEIKLEKLAAEIEETVREQISLQSAQNPMDASDIKEVSEEISREMLEGVFWEEINQTLEDPFFRLYYSDGDWGEEFQTGQGTVEELLEFLELCVLTEREIGDVDKEGYLIVETETDFNLAGLSDCSYYSERLNRLVEIACAYYQPTGYRYDYNDGCYDRVSGYSLDSESVSISLAEAARASVQEKMLGMVRLREKLAQMNAPPDKIEGLTVF
jgi:hypothetical protein